MTFSYTGAGNSDQDTVRFLLQDTDPTEALLSDEEILYMISLWKESFSLFYVASACAETLAARYAREASISGDGVSVSLGIVAQQFRELAASLRQQHKNLLVGGSPDVGGISPYEGQDPNIAPFSFGTGMHDDLDAGPQDYGSRETVYYVAERQPGE